MTPYWLMLWAAIVMSMAGQTMLKAGAQADTFMHQIFDWKTLAGFCVYGASSLCYIVALRKIPLSAALPCTAISYVAAALIGHFVFGEALTAMRMGAIALILGGVVLLVL